MIGRYQVTELFGLRFGFSVASSAGKPCHLGPRACVSIFGLSGSECKYCASLSLVPLSCGFPNLSPERCVRERLCLPDYL